MRNDHINRLAYEVLHVANHMLDLVSKAADIDDPTAMDAKALIDAYHLLIKVAKDKRLEAHESLYHDIEES